MNCTLFAPSSTYIFSCFLIRYYFSLHVIVICGYAAERPYRK